MSELQIVKSEHFGSVEADIYSNGKEMFMTINQLAECLGYSDKNGVQKIVDRNPYLNEPQFSGWDNLSLPQGGTQKTRIFTEDGIYEVTMLSKQPKAREFRAWVRKILKALRRGDAKVVSMTDYQRAMAETRIQNIHIRKAQLLERMAEDYEGTYRQILQAHATKELTGEFLLPLPSLPRKTLSAEEIGERLGISANRVGRIANACNLKTEAYGQWFVDKARSANKEVSTFRYFESVLPEIEKALQAKTV